MVEERRNALSPGTEFEGYRIESILGAGGFGITYRATEVLLDRQVAIKEFLPSGLALRESDGLRIVPLGATETEAFDWGMERFRIEAQTLVAFRHPNIVSVHRYFETHGTGYLVMEYVEGRTLEQLLQPDRMLGEGEIRDIAGPILDGLEAVHEKGFLHRDVKPANIFLRGDGTPVLIDFGAARQALGERSKSLTSVISAGYAPYEQYDSAGNQGPWTDIYAIGGVLYRCITGDRPPDAPSRVSAVFGGKTDPLVPAAEAADGPYSPALLAVVDRCLAVREAERPATVAELRALLDGTALAGAPKDDAPEDEREPEPTGGGTTLLAGAATTPVASATPPTPAGRSPAGRTHSPEPPPASTASSGKYPSSPPRRVNWVIVGSVVAVLLVLVAAGTWAIVDNQESQSACMRIAKEAEDAFGRNDLKVLNARIADAVAGNCAAATVSEFRRKAEIVSTLLKQTDRRRPADQKDHPRKTDADKSPDKPDKDADADRLADPKRLADCNALRRELRRHSRNPDGISSLVERSQTMGCPKAETDFLRSAIPFYRGQEAMRRHEYERAVGHFDQALRTKKTYSGHFARGIAYFRLRNHNAATLDFTAAIKLRPQSHRAYANRGAAYANLRRRTEAIRDVRKALELKRDYVFAQNLLDRLTGR